MIGSRLNGGHLGGIGYKYPVHGHNIHSLATVNYQLPRGETLFHLPLTNILENIQRLFNNNPKIFQDSFACRSILAANYQLYSGNIQRLSGQQSETATSNSNQQQKPKAATSNSNQKQRPATTINSSNQKQRPATAINSSNQQQQSTAANKSSDQQQHSTAATKSSVRQQQSTAATTSFRPTSITSTIHDDLR